jgi:hypothetical protein
LLPGPGSTNAWIIQQKLSPLVSEAVGTVPHVAISRRTQEPRLKRVKGEVERDKVCTIVKLASRPISIQTNSPIRDDETTYDDGVRPVLNRVDETHVDLYYLNASSREENATPRAKFRNKQKIFVFLL